MTGRPITFDASFHRRGGVGQRSRGIKIVGPSLKHVGTNAQTRKPGLSASDYIHESIRTPNAYVVDGFSPNIMPPNFAELLQPGEIDALVAYLLTLK